MRINTVHRASKRVLREDGTPKIKCGECNVAIMPGDAYRWAKGRYTSKKVRCALHNFKASDLTDSKKSQAYAALEDLMATIETASSVEDITAAFDTARDELQEVVDEYTEAAEHFGGQGPSQDAADEIESAIGELEALDEPDEDNEDFDLDEFRNEALAAAESAYGSF